MGCNVGCPNIKNGFYDNFNEEDPTGKSDEEFIRVIEDIKSKIFKL